MVDHGVHEPNDVVDARECELSIDEHVEMTMTALTLFGVGIGCETQYRALMVIAEVARRLHRHAHFDPREKADEIEQRAREAQLRAEAHTATEAHTASSGSGFEMSGDEQVH